MRRRSRRRLLDDGQRKLVYAASQLVPPDLRSHFILLIAQRLKVNGYAAVSDERLQATITQALDEVQTA